MKPGVAPRRTSTVIASLVLLALSLLSTVRPAAVYTLVHRPGGVVRWYEEGLELRVPEGFAARQARHEPVVTLYGQTSASESVLETTALQNNYTAMVASGVLVLINTFCMHSGTDLQEVLTAAPYYFLGQNTVPVDVLQLSPQSVNVSINTAQGVFQSAGPSRNTALITLTANPAQDMGTSIVMITKAAKVAALHTTTQALLASMRQFPPMMPNVNGTVSWFDYLAGNKLSVTSFVPRALDSHFIAAADGSCQAVVQGQVQRQGQWSVAGKCLVETTPDGSKYHALQLEATSGSVYFGSQKWDLAPSATQAGLRATAAGGALATPAGSSPCTFTQPDGTLGAPAPCSTACTQSDGTPANYTTPCILGADPNITCTACGSVLGNLPFTDTAALPNATSSTYSLTCSGNCSAVAYFYMLQGLPTSLCNETCIPNEVAWAKAHLQNPRIPAACNTTCQAQHDSFLLSIQQDNLALSDTAQRRRKLLQELPEPCIPDECDNCCDRCCLQEQENNEVDFIPCPSGVDKCSFVDLPPPPPPSPPCNGVQLCDSCSSQDQTPCADPVRDDLPSTEITGYDCTTCDNTAKIRSMAANSDGGGSPSTDWGKVAVGFLKIAIAVL